MDWAVGGAALMVACTVLKGMTGRPRPRLGDPEGFVGPLGVYAAPTGDGGVRFLNAWSGGSELASMPSRHTAFAVLAAVFLSAVYPRVSPLVWGLAVVVGVARVLTGAHYPTDVLAGAALGLLIGRYAIDRQWGGGLVEWIAARRGGVARA
jgi:membrane-associated phospholipid phosphatase